MDDGTGAPDRRIGTLPLSEVFGRSGRDFFAALIAGEVPVPPIADTVPMTFREATEGRIVVTARPEARFMNPIGSIHGGYAAVLLDTALGCAVHTTLGAGEAYTSLEIKCSFHRALQPETGEITVTGTVISRGRRAASAEARIEDAQGRLLASGSSTCLIFALPTDAA